MGLFLARGWKCIYLLHLRAIFRGIALRGFSYERVGSVTSLLEVLSGNPAEADAPVGPLSCREAESVSAA